MVNKFYPPAGFHFKVFIAGFPQDGLDTAFQEVEGISMNLETTPLIEGGMNYMSRKLPVRTSYGDLKLKRGMIPMDSKLAKWCFDSFGTNSNGLIKTKLVTVQLLAESDNGGKPKLVCTWTFNNAYPINWEVSGFNAQQSSVVVESITLTYSFFQVEGVTNGEKVGSAS